MTDRNTASKQSRLQERIDSLRPGRVRRDRVEPEAADDAKGPAPAREASPPKREQAPEPERQRPRTPVETPPRGTLLHLSTGQVVVHLGDGSDRPHQRVYLLEADGGVALKRISLFESFEFRRIGMLHERDLHSLAETASWDRDLIVFHLDALDDRALLPGSPSRGPRTASRGPASESQAGRREEGEALRRGQRFEIEFKPGRAWEAVYWGRDNQGTVVAHRTEGEWKLMHMELDRYRQSLRPGAALEPREQEEIVEALRKRRA